MEPSVLATRVVGKAADVGFIDGVQERAVSLQHKQTIIVTHVCVLKGCLKVHGVRLQKEREFSPGSDSAVWPEAGFWIELCSHPAVGVGLGLSGRDCSPG